MTTVTTRRKALRKRSCDRIEKRSGATLATFVLTGTICALIGVTGVLTSAIFDTIAAVVSDHEYFPPIVATSGLWDRPCVGLSPFLIDLREIFGADGGQDVCRVSHPVVTTPGSDLFALRAHSWRDARRLQTVRRSSRGHKCPI